MFVHNLPGLLRGRGGGRLHADGEVLFGVGELLQTGESHPACRHGRLSRVGEETSRMEGWGRFSRVACGMGVGYSRSGMGEVLGASSGAKPALNDIGR